MNIHNSTLITLCLAVVFSASTRAKEVPVYRWIDENNVVHFSQHQPKNSEYDKLTTISTYKVQEPSLPVPDELPPVDKPLSAIESERDEIIAKNKAIIEKNCEASKLNEKILSSTDRITSQGPDGKNFVLTEKEKKEKVALNRKNIELYCKK